MIRREYGSPMRPIACLAEPVRRLRDASDFVLTAGAGGGV